MKEDINKKPILRFIAALFMGVFFALPVSASTTDGVIDSVYKYAWGENIGWINFGTSNGNVHVTDSGLSGYALSESVGWINLNNITNDAEGNLSGLGWSENTGWIKFDPDNGGVTIDSSGEFVGSALSENVGWIIFGGDYKVRTDWRPRSVRESTSGGGGYSFGVNIFPIIPPGGFKISINPSISPEQTQDAGYTNSRNVILKFNAGPDVKKMVIYEPSNFINASQEEYVSVKQFTLSEGEGVKIIYVKFYNQYGAVSEAVSDTIVFKTTPVEADSDDKKLGISGNKRMNLDDSGAKSSSDQPPVFVFTKSLWLGSYGFEVVQLQNKLKELNFFPQQIKSNGSFGPVTQKAVMDFQKFHGIYPIGIVGPRTKKALNGEEFITNKDYRFDQDLKYDDKGESVKQLQTRLRNQNFFPYNISSTGWFGPITKKAVNLFKGLYDLIKDGIVDGEMRGVLNK